MTAPDLPPHPYPLWVGDRWVSTSVDTWWQPLNLPAPHIPARTETTGAQR